MTMSTQSPLLFKALAAKMDYLSKRQAVISQNIANADTPGYRPHDLTPVDFKSALSKLTGSQLQNVATEKTSTSHIREGELDNIDGRTKKQKRTYEVAPVGNAVIIEEQMMSASQNVMDYNLMTNIYQKYISMVKTVAAQ
jgi:flagellar basal-body rod protein FlgB